MQYLSTRRATRLDELAQFAGCSASDDISEPAREQLKPRVMDSLNVAFGALDGEPTQPLQPAHDLRVVP